MIREARPCHLYFDLEFVPAVNAGVQGDALVDALLRLVAAELRCVAGGACQAESMKYSPPVALADCTVSGCQDCLACRSAPCGL